MKKNTHLDFGRTTRGTCPEGFFFDYRHREENSSKHKPDTQFGRSTRHRVR